MGGGGDWRGGQVGGAYVGDGGGGRGGRVGAAGARFAVPAVPTAVSARCAAAHLAVPELAGEAGVFDQPSPSLVFRTYAAAAAQARA